ncbi:YdaU family protein [Sinorhizobium meliloti]|uniref:YdaU family protein n=1 Tax=Rhizobium meliloti TaxID=382 RepID=UPI00067F6660|nr:DUF1376 domain-containing protein [Sinorhizobium meliloti]
MSHLHWMPLYIGDELAETSHLTAEEFGAYLSLKMHYWQHGGLPKDDRRLERIARCSSEQWSQVRAAIMSLFYEGWRLPRLEEQRIEAEEKHTKRVEAGRKGGRPKKDEKQSYKQSFSDEKAGLKQPQPQPQPHPHLDPERQSEPQPQGSAYERKDADRKSMFTPFPIPSSTAKAREFLNSKGVPSSRMDECIRLMMGGNFSRFDLEGVLSEARSAAA